MSANFYQLLKYAATGIASPDMTYYDRMRASALMGGVVQTLTGIPPLSFKSNGTPLISWSMKGNGSQQGTPTPDAPIMPEFVGVKTANLFDKNQTTGIISGKYINQNGVFSTNQYYYVSYPIRLTIGETYTWSFGSGLITHSSPTIGFYDSGDNLLSVASHASSIAHFSFTVPEGCAYILASVYTREPDHPFEPMLISGTVPQADNIPIPWYEPYGYKIPLTCAGQTVPVYLGQTQTVRRIQKLVLDGTEDVTRRSSPENSYSLNLVRSGYSEGLRVNGYCTHFSQISSASSMTDGTCYCGTTAISFRMNSVTDETAFKSYLASEYAAGHPVSVWYVLATEQTGITNEPLCKIGDYADELHSEDAGVTIPTSKGSNTLTVDTDLQPSEMTITFKG